MYHIHYGRIPEACFYVVCFVNGRILSKGDTNVIMGVIIFQASGIGHAWEDTAIDLFCCMLLALVSASYMSYLRIGRYWPSCNLFISLVLLYLQALLLHEIVPVKIQV